MYTDSDDMAKLERKAKDEIDAYLDLLEQAKSESLNQDGGIKNGKNMENH